MTSFERRFEKVKTAIYFVKLVRKRIKQIFSGSLDKQSLTPRTLKCENFEILRNYRNKRETMLETICKLMSWHCFW